MRLLRLSILSSVGCLLGLGILLAMAVASHQRMQATQQQIAELVELHGRLDSLSSASDALLVHGAEPGLWAAFRDEAEALRARLELEDHPQAHRAADRIGEIVAALESAEVTRESPVPDSQVEPGAPGGPLDVPVRARLLINQVAGHGIALDTAVDTMLRERQQALARDTLWIAGGFAAAALLFGAICVLAFTLIHRRMTGPIRSLSDTISALSAGDGDARVPVTGNDELTEVAAAFNGLADQRQAAITDLEQNQQMLAESQRIAGIGSWQLSVDDMSLTWSPETYRIVGVNPATFEPSPDAFFAHVHADDLDALLSTREHALAEGGAHDLEFRLVRGNGEVRHVHERAEIERDTAGNARHLTGTIQDVTEQRRLTDYQHLFRRLIEASSDRFAVIDADYRYQLCNGAYASLFQRERSAVEGRHIDEVLGPLFGQGFVDEHIRPPIERCLGGEPQIFETERTHPDLGRRQVLLRYYPIASADGGLHHIGVVMTDLTEMKQAEAEIREQRQLLAMAGRVARLGAWSADVESGDITWSDVVAEIHAMPPGYRPDVEEAIAFYAPEHRERIRTQFFGCVENGTPFDDEFEIVDAHGQRRWVRTAGEPQRDESGTIVRVQGALQDISARKAAELEVSRLAERLSTILDSITDAMLTVGPDWRIDYVNAAAERLLGYPHGYLEGRDLWTEFPGAVGTRIEHEYRRSVTEGETATLEEYYAPLGMWLDIRAYPSEEGLAIFFRDVTERRTMLARLEAQERDLRSSRDELAQALETRQALINGLPAHIALIDGCGNLLDVNERWRQFARDNGYDHPAHGLGVNYLEVCDPAGGGEAGRAREGLRAVLSGERQIYTLEYPCHAPEEQRWFRMMANRLESGRSQAGDAAAVVMHIDITERKQAEQELNRLAYEDALTGLPSRNGFTRRVNDEVSARGWQAESTVAVLDIRGLREINDAHGYTVGDHLLQELARRLEERTGDGAVVGRIGGDEFAVFLPARGDVSSAQQRAAVAESFARDFQVDAMQLETRATYGYTLLGTEAREPEDLLREAELALFQARRGDVGTQWMPYTSVLHEEERKRTRTTRELRHALARDEFQLHFQPKVDLRDGRLVGCEALLRWAHPEHGLQSPATFIHTAESSQLIGPIGDWAINEACRCLSAWQSDELPVVRVAVNVSLVQFMVGDLTETVHQVLATHDVAPGGLTLEITESVFEQESDMLLQQLQTVHEMGVRLSLDDFGTGYSSLLYLQKYPFDEIKIDRGFVNRMLVDDYSSKIVSTVIGIAAGLGADAVAEGVETAEVRNALVAMGCYTGQGYYYGFPLEAEDFRWLLEQRSPLPLGIDASSQ